MAQVQGQWTMPLSVTDTIAMIAQLPIAANHQINLRTGQRLFQNQVEDIEQHISYQIDCIIQESHVFNFIQRENLFQIQ